MLLTDLFPKLPVNRHFPELRWMLEVPMAAFLADHAAASLHVRPSARIPTQRIQDP
jgi:hypothetical protein